MNSAARRIARRRAILREALRRLGATAAVVAMAAVLVAGDRLASHWRASAGHTYTGEHHAAR